MLRGHWLVGLVLRICAIKYGKEGFAWVFSVLEKALVGGGWLFEQRRCVL